MRDNAQSETVSLAANHLAAGERTQLSLTAEERTVLERWVSRGDPLSRRAKIILASEQMQNVAEISRYAGVHPVSVYTWRKRFRVGRLEGLAPKGWTSVPSEVKQELEKILSSNHPQLARRAAFILDVAQTYDVPGAAKRADISSKTALQWRRAFNNAGIAGLEHPARATARKFGPLSAEELDALRAWSESNRPFSRRARIILALAEGGTIETVAGTLGLSNSTVAVWQRRFLRNGLSGVQPKGALNVSPDQRRSLEEMQRFSAPNVSRRATLLLEYLRCGDLDAAAARQNVSLTAARNWRHAFIARGVAGLTAPRVPPPPAPPRSPMPLTISMHLPVDVCIPTEAENMKVNGVTLVVCSRYFTIRQTEGLTQPVRPGSRVVANVHWPAHPHDGKPILLRLRGTLEQTDSATMRIAVRTFAFTPRE